MAAESKKQMSWHGCMTMLAGGIAGSVAKTATAPLSRLTILYQVSSLVQNSSHNGNISASVATGNFNGSVWQTFSRVLHEEGMWSFWKGNFVSVLHRFPYSSINFSSYEFFRTLIVDSGFEESGLVRLFCGGMAGGIACFACYPLDLVRTRLTVIDKASCGLRPASMVDCISHIVRTEGLRGLYRGCLMSVFVSVPNLAIGFSAYGASKEVLQSNSLLVHPVTHEVTPLGSMFSGAMSGICSSLVVFPADVIRRRLQVEGALRTPSSLQTPPSHPISSLSSTRPIKNTTPGDDGRGKTALADLRRVLKTEGVGGLYRGILVELLKVTPMVAITFSVYEAVLGILES